MHSAVDWPARFNPIRRVQGESALIAEIQSRHFGPNSDVPFYQCCGWSALSFCLLVVVLLSLCTPVHGETQHAVPVPDESRPNVVLIVIDTLRADKLGCYGFPHDTSPELDAMARSGVQFMRVIAQSSWTRPSIGSMLTSRYPRSLGLYKNPDILADRFTTLAEVFQAAGYRTIGATANPVINSVFNMHQGFDRYINSTVVFSWMRKIAKSQQAFPSRTTNKLPSAQDVFEVVHDEIRQGGGPFYLQLNVMEMHEAWRGLRSLTRREFRNSFKGVESKDYLGALRQVSLDIGLFVSQLRSMEGWDNTVFVITSDHGQGLKDHPHVRFSASHGRLLYESQVLVPLILYHPGSGLASRKIQRPVRLLDLMPTLLEYLGIEPPPGIDGVSLCPLMSGEAGHVALPAHFMTETYFRGNNKIAVYTDTWKYIENREPHRGVNAYELQRMGIKEDGKRTDEIGRFPEVAAELKSYIEAWERRVPQGESTPLDEGLPEEVSEQLKAIGYL